MAHVVHIAQGMLPHHGFNLLISVDIECYCVECYPWVYCTQ